MKNCELCKLQARTYCESDQASLCWSCDAKVHAANFLVARHSRTLLCHVCQSPTPWKASGEKLGHTVSVCNRCVNGQVEDQESQGANDDADDEDEDYDDDDVEEDEEEEEDEEVEEEEEDGENQVVPWSSMTATPPPPAASSSSSSEDFSDSVNVKSLKRFREDASDLQSQQDDLNCFSSKRKYGSTTLTAQAATVDSLSPLQDQRTEPDRLESSVVIVEPHKRSRNQRGKGNHSKMSSFAQIPQITLSNKLFKPEKENMESTKSHQNVVVMRHGDRADNFEPMWVSSAARPWDPHLVNDGLIRAYSTGRKLRTQLGFPIHRVFVSPFLRCIQTASEVVYALCAVDEDPNAMSSKDVISIDASRVKVSVEYGLCEMMNRHAIKLDIAPKDGDFGFNIAEAEALLPAETVDNSVKRVYEEMPQWEETVSDTRSRYERIIKALADKYPSENLLLVSHGEAVGVAVSAFMKEDVSVHEVMYCAYTELRRPILFENGSFTAGEFDILSSPAQSGVSYIPTTSTDK